MRRADEEMVDANVDIEYYYKLKRKMRRIDEKIQELDARINTYGVSSPKIMSAEEAKYQKGTRIHTDAPLLELIAEQDRLKEEQAAVNIIYCRIHDRLKALNMTQEEMTIMRMRYEFRATYETIAETLHYSKATIQCKIDAILRRYINLKD